MKRGSLAAFASSDNVMNILLTNDDGYDAEGLLSLVETLSMDHEIRVLAPDKERSGVSHAITLVDAQKIQKVGENAYSCSGTPADCVLLAMLGAIDFRPDAVISGINRGPNLGTDIVYSGTCAAAIEAVLCGIPGIAVSCASRENQLNYGAAASFVKRNLAALVAACSATTFVNVNAPSAEYGSLIAQWTFPSTRIYANELKSFSGPDGFEYCFLTGSASSVKAKESSDFAVVSMGRISASPVLVQPQVPTGFLFEREFS